MEIIKWIDDVIEGTEKSAKENLDYLMKQLEKGNTDTREFSHILIGLRDDERDIALLSLVKEMILEEKEEK